MYDQFVDVNCFICDRELHDVEKIFIGFDDDRYYCDRCASKHDIECSNLLEELNG